MISRTEFLYNACVSALDSLGFDGGNIVYSVYQDDPDETTAVIYTLTGEDWYQTL